jgi:hypothetical protein
MGENMGEELRVRSEGEECRCEMRVNDWVSNNGGAPA